MANFIEILAAKLVIPMVLMYLLVSAPYVESVVSCGSVATRIAPCLKYLTSNSPLQVPCCVGVKALYAAAPTKADRQATCGCVKKILAGIITQLNQGHLSSLPASCGIPLPYTITPSINCATVY